MAFLLFYVTHADEAAAQQMAAQLLERHLIACANIFPMSSAFWWEGAQQHEQEWVSVLKTRTTLETALETFITQFHPYQTPCMLRWPVHANAAYEQWIMAETENALLP
ncbi:MAG: divalent-cation tolerance protein CutA [Lewinellaceae bacterium]|nr:divalent-cation tolerance protein CutA [Lewinellaceae bacterium]